MVCLTFEKELETEINIHRVQDIAVYQQPDDP
jgi:hypothetical protein